MPKSLIVAFALLSTVPLLGCGPANPPDQGQQRFTHSGDYPIQVTATVGMVADIVRAVGGDHVEVTQLMGASVDPHLYKVNRDDVRKLSSADVVFYSGLLLEGKMTDTLVKIGRSRLVVAVTEEIDEEYLLEPDGAEGHPDPHVWMDVSAWSKCVGVVTKILKEYDPTNADEYEANATKYQAQLDKLHAYGKDVIATIPEESRILITSHDAFNYFGRAYELDVEGVQGLSTESEAGLERINTLVDEIVEKKVPAVFVESSVSKKTISSLIDGATSRGATVTIGGELYSDAMGKEDTYEGTYIGMMDHNLTIVARALGGEAPERGMQGKLNVESQ